MNLCIYRMIFKTAHFGEGKLSESAKTFSSNRLYSALLIEAIQQGCLEDFLQYTHSDEFILSDGFPYESEPYLPKPIGFPLHKAPYNNSLSEIRLTRRDSKMSKKIQFIKASYLTDFINDAEHLEDFLQEEQSNALLCEHTRKGIDPYQIGISNYSSKSLYVIAPSSGLVKQLMLGLQYSGFGGKRTSGLGSFQLITEKIDNELSSILSNQRGSYYMTLSNCIPNTDTTPDITKGAKYRLRKNSGFAFSNVVTEQLRKQDTYSFQSGSVFRRTFTGCIKDVAPEGYAHPVLFYAKPFWIKMEVNHD